jgi:hypothetical protein
MPPVEFEPTILVSERPKTHALDRTATGIGEDYILCRAKWLCPVLLSFRTGMSQVVERVLH